MKRGRIPNGCHDESDPTIEKINSLLTEQMVIHIRIQSSYVIKVDLF